MGWPLTIPPGTRVLISKRGDCHYGHVGTVDSVGQESASSVAIDQCRHWYHNAELRLAPESDTIPAPVDL
jgi:hypothetical protein